MKENKKERRAFLFFVDQKKKRKEKERKEKAKNFAVRPSTLSSSKLPASERHRERSSRICASISFFLFFSPIITIFHQQEPRAFPCSPHSPYHQSDVTVRVFPVVRQWRQASLVHSWHDIGPPRCLQSSTPLTESPSLCRSSHQSQDSPRGTQSLAGDADQGISRQHDGSQEILSNFKKKGNSIQEKRKILIGKVQQEDEDEEYQWEILWVWSWTIAETWGSTFLSCLGRFGEGRSQQIKE